MFWIIKKSKRQKGFTFIELMLVVAMIAMLAGMTVPITFGSLKKQSVEEESSKLLSVLRQTQAKSMKGRGDSPWGVYFTPESYTVFKGNSYEERESVYDEVFEISPSMSVAGAPEIVFDYEGIPRIKGLVGHWTMNEGEGGVAHDLSGQENHGTLVNGPTWANGKVGGALDFDGVDDYVDCGNDDILDVIDDITIISWIKTTQTTFGSIVSKYDAVGGQRSYILSIGHAESGPGYLRLVISPTVDPYTGFGLSSNIMVNDDIWHNVVVVFNAGESAKIFVDGVDQTGDMLGSIQSSIAISNRDLVIGSSYNNSLIPNEARFNGLIDDVRIYNRALSAEEIRLIYESGLDGVDDNIVELSGGGESVKINIGRQGRIEVVR
jgi:prepilin-type N-terminal cleavage/methylation domain-containing protein